MKKYLYIGVGVVLIALLLILPRIFPVFDTKALLIEAVMVSQNAKSLDFYGKIVDQNGDPVAGVKVTAKVGVIISFTASGGYDATTLSDASGLFKFVGIHGSGTGFLLQKDGYEFNARLAVSGRPKDYVPDPNHPVIFPMWKLKGPEPMFHTDLQAGLACDGTPRNFNLRIPRRDSGNFVASLTRNPLNIDGGKPFDWTLTLSISGGGLIEIADSYPYEAPASGYNSISIKMPSDLKTWSPEAVKSYYFYDGKNYGRVTVDIMASYQPPPTHIEFDAYINPSGSRNLEFDPTKQINP